MDGGFKVFKMARCWTLSARALKKHLFPGTAKNSPQKEQTHNRHCVMGTQPCQPIQPTQNAELRQSQLLESHTKDKKASMQFSEWGKCDNSCKKSLPKSWWPWECHSNPNIMLSHCKKWYGPSQITSAHSEEGLSAVVVGEAGQDTGATYNLK